MSFHKASKQMNIYSHSLTAYKWFMCLLKLVPHRVRNGTISIDDPGGTGYCTDHNLYEWENK